MRENDYYKNLQDAFSWERKFVYKWIISLKLAWREITREGSQSRVCVCVMRDAHTYTPHVNNLNYRLSRTEGLNIPTTIIVDSFKRIKNGLKFVQTTVNNHTKILTFDDTRLSRLKLFPSIDFNVERKVLTLELIPTCSKRCSISWTKNSSSMSISEVFINGRNEIGISNAALRSVKILPGQISIRLMGNDDRINNRINSNASGLPRSLRLLHGSQSM